MGQHGNGYARAKTYVVGIAAMFNADRLRARMAERSLSQSELARRVGVSQASIYRLVKGEAYGSKHLHRIARELGTTPEYLAGETDDPDENAPPPRPVPAIQYITMQVGLPSENALADMYEGQLRAFARLEGAELARALAKRLPKALARLQAADLYEVSDAVPDDREAAEPRPPDHREPRQAQRK